MMTDFAKIIVDAGMADYLLEDATGNFTTLLVEPVDREDFRNTLQNTLGLPESTAPLTMTDLTTPFWLQGLVADDALYIKYNWVFPETNAGLTIGQFSNLVRNYVANNDPDKVIVDIRHNGGGDATTYAPFLNALSDPDINQTGKLYVIIGRSTFSAAANFVTQVEQRTNARFVGEPTGGSPNNYGDSISFELPRSGFEIRIPTIYWVYSPGDSRTSIAPDISVEWTWSDYSNQLDPVLQAALDD